MPPFRLTVPHPLFLLISARYVYETLAFHKKCRPAIKKKILTIQETQIINGWYTFSPQRPTNGLNTFFLGFFFKEDIKNIQNATVQNFQKRQFLYQATLQNVAPQLVARSRGLRRATRGTGKRQRSPLLMPGGKQDVLRALLAW